VLEDILRQKATWIQRGIQQQQTRQTHQTSLVQRLAQQQPIPVLGQPYTIQHHVGKTALLNPHTHTISLPQGPNTAQLHALETVLKHQAVQTFTSLAQQLAQKHKLPTFQIHLSSPKARWGSCDQAGNIRINWRLIHHPLPRIQYVIAHELAHLIELNHSPRFWAWVQQLMPNYPAIEAELRQFSPALVPLV
jgi:predicted metal-dependent hydrolase